MNCSRCGTFVPEGQKFCSKCGNEIDNINIENNQQDKTKSNRNLIVILILVVVIIAGLIIGYFTLSKSPTEKEEPTNKLGKVTITENEGDFKAYKLMLENFSYGNKYDFKLDNGHIITLDFFDMESQELWNVYVDGNYIFRDVNTFSWDEDDDSENIPSIELNAYTYGDYVVMTNVGYTYIKSEHIYVIGKNGKLEKDIYHAYDDEVMIHSDLTEINSSGITIDADRGSDTKDYACDKKIDDISDCAINLCDKSSWPSDFTEDTVYSAIIKYEYSNGKFDFNGKVLESKTVGEHIIEEDLANYYCSVE